MKLGESTAGRVGFRLQRFWSRIREWCGDAAYERYLRASSQAGGQVKLNAEEFYLEQVNRRYSEPNRCC